MAKFNPTITVHLVPYIREGNDNKNILLMSERISYIMVTCALPDIYTLALRPAVLRQVHIYQAKHSFPWYNYY